MAKDLKINMAMINGRKKGQYLRARDAFTFGKYKGRIILDVAKTDPDYIIFCMEKIEWFIFTSPDRQELEKAMDIPNLHLRNRHGKVRERHRQRVQDTRDKFEEPDRGRFGDNEYGDKAPWED